MQATEMEPSGIEANPVALNAIMRASEKHLIVACEDIVDARGFKLWAGFSQLATEVAGATA